MTLTLRSFYNWLHPLPMKRTPTTDETRKEASLAVEDAYMTLRDVQSNKENVQHKVFQLRDQREKNHFAELIQATMRGNG